MKPKNFKHTVSRLIVYLRRYRSSLGLVLAVALLGTLFQIAAPKLTGLIVTELFDGALARLQGVESPGIDMAFIARILVLLSILYAFSALFSYVQLWFAGNLAQRTVFDLRRELNHKFAKLPLGYYDARSSGDLLSRAVNDVDNVSNTLQQVVSQFLSSVITIVGIVIMMLAVNFWMTVAVLVTLPLSFFGMKTIAKRSMPHFQAMQRSLGELNGHVEETYSAHSTVKAYGTEQENLRAFRKKNEELYRAGKLAPFISGLVMPLISMINNLGYIAICLLGGFLVTRGAIGIGDVQAFIQYSRSFSQPLMQAANIVNMIQSGVASAERIFEILDEAEEIPESSKPSRIPSPRGEVRFERIDFSYKEETRLIESLNLHVDQGAKVAIVGPTGAGKSTMVNLLMRFYEVDAGRITVDGFDIAMLTREDLRSLFGMVLQDTWLFTGTIRDNIAFGKPGAKEVEIQEAAVLAHADVFIRQLPDGYDTVINEEGGSLSQGQKQLLTIARAILADPVILLLDEATSNVDTRTEAYIQQAMKSLMQDRTTFIIAHRLSTVRDADLILVMDQGSIIEQGTHEELLKLQGFYSELYNSQFESAETA
ncbi:ABC transporter ATP-binding protein [Cohnella herbarum]|uniref:ABC transporter ATP-binding protein n=1 Tax=Cohnella herbarum TaxID=2728023 RepID=A0A7Z2VL04_9BACL|nr:ABC transporter ATP-binding protein [Cohnella herbarum]QJD85017.1 ABC transporter ATP-binding protein [Cohnella herbarum]